MKITSPQLEAMAVSEKQYPSGHLKEIALAGRSNVGKSTFLNSFVNRKKLAYTSSSPGKTRTVNFYNIDGRFRLVDLPGYGYAKASKADQEKWAESIDEYLSVRDNLKEVILLCDLRHKPTVQDKEMYEWILAAGFTGYIIGTKADKIAKTKVIQHEKEIMTSLGLKNRDLIFTYSSLDRSGMKDIHSLIENIIK